MTASPVKVDAHNTDPRQSKSAGLEDRRSAAPPPTHHTSSPSSNMVLIRFASVIAAASLLMTAAAQSTSTPTTTIKNPVTTPTVIKDARAMVELGCYATGTPLENHGPFLYQSPGNCQLVCLQFNKNVMGVSDGENCWCGDMIPPKESKVDNSLCDTGCGGDNNTMCT